MTLVRKETRWGHGYTLDGKPVKGVTTLLNLGLPKPALTRWAAKSVAEWVADNDDKIEALRGMGRGPMVDALKAVPWEQRDTAAARGTEVHALAEELVHGRRPVEVPEHIEGHVDGYVRWLDAWHAEPVWTERPVASRKWWYAGTFDLIAQIGDTTWLLDVKTAKGVYGDNALQLAAYANADFLLDEEGGECALPYIERLGVLHVRADGTDLIPVMDPARAWKDFLHVAWVGKAEDRIKRYMGDPMTAPESEHVA